MVELVPARVVRRVVEPEIRTYVEQRRSARDDLGGHLRGHAVGQRGEDRVGLGDRLVDDEPRLAQVRMRGLDRLFLAVSAVQAREPDVGVGK